MLTTTVTSFWCTVIGKVITLQSWEAVLLLRRWSNASSKQTQMFTVLLNTSNFSNKSYKNIWQGDWLANLGDSLVAHNSFVIE